MCSGGEGRRAGRRQCAPEWEGLPAEAQRRGKCFGERLARVLGPGCAEASGPSGHREEMLVSSECCWGACEEVPDGGRVVQEEQGGDDRCMRAELKFGRGAKGRAGKSWSERNKAGGGCRQPEGTSQWCGWAPGDPRGTATLLSREAPSLQL